MSRTSRTYQNTEEYDCFLGEEMSPYSTYFSQENQVTAPCQDFEDVDISQESGLRLWARVKMFFSRAEQPAA